MTVKKGKAFKLTKEEQKIEDEIIRLGYKPVSRKEYSRIKAVIAKRKKP